MSFQFNKTWKLLCAAIVLTAAMSEVNRAEAFVATKPEELQQRNVWLKERLLDEKPQLPFSFRYDGKKSEELLAAWPKKATTKKLDDVRTQHTLVWTDPKTGIEVRSVVVEYTDNPEIGEGVVQAFRRLKSEKSSKTFRFFGLDPAARYKLTNLDAGVSTEASGKDLMEKGLTVEIKDKPGAAIITYRRKESSPSAAR